MAEPQQNPGVKHHFYRARKLALALSLSIASSVLFLIYEYQRDVYDRLSFWELRWQAFGLVFLVVFAVLWLRARRAKASGAAEP